MIKVTETNKQKAIDYLLCEPYFNTYILGDIEVFGINGSEVSLYSLEEDDNIKCILMFYNGDFVIYSKDCSFDTEKVSKTINNIKTDDDFCLSGKGSAIDRISSYFPNKKKRTTCLASLDKLINNEISKNEIEISALNEDNSLDLLELYLAIDEFKEKYSRVGEEGVKFGFKSGRTYGIYKGSKLIAAASSTAESKQCAMITNVCTHPDFRKNGFAYKILIKLITDIIDDGVKNICIYYDNPEAGKLYKKIGFCEKGTYKTLK